MTAPMNCLRLSRQRRLWDFGLEAACPGRKKTTNDRRMITTTSSSAKVNPCSPESRLQFPGVERSFIVAVKLAKCQRECTKVFGCRLDGMRATHAKCVKISLMDDCLDREIS